MAHSDELDAEAIAKSSAKYLSTVRGATTVKSSKVPSIVMTLWNAGVRHPILSKAATNDPADPLTEMEGRFEAETVDCA